MGIINMGLGSLLSGGIISHGTVESYVSNIARKSLGLGLSVFQDGSVRYFSKDKEILKRAAVQTASQLAYGMLRSYPRYIKYWEQVERDKYLKNKSQTSRANVNGQYRQLIDRQQALAEEKKYADTIVGEIVKDYLELEIPGEGSYYDYQSGKVEQNSKYGLVKFADLQPVVQVSSKNNVLLTTVQGRDYTRKELVSGGDLEISIHGKITSKYPDVYPEAEVSKFLKLMQYRGVINCDNTILRQFKISRLIVLNYSLTPSECRNIQPYTLTCVAVEPSEAIELKIAGQEEVDRSISDVNKWLQFVRFGTRVIDPGSLMQFTKQWI